MSGRLDADLREIADVARDDIKHFAGARFLITGGTGFIGTWLLWSIVYANVRFGTDIAVDVLSRHPEAFAEREPFIASSPDIRLIRGDVLDDVRPQETYDAIIHAATPASATLLNDDPQAMLDIIVRGTRNIVDVAERSGPIPLLLTSSGAVYGRLPAQLLAVEETYSGGPDQTDIRAAYQEGKRCAELMCSIFAGRSGGRALLARLFAFVGPYLPLDLHYAMGNFLRNRLESLPIQVAGDGTAVRSYLYATDMIAWLWAVLARGESRRAYNIGSEDAVTIAELSSRIANLETPALKVHVAQTAVPGAAIDRYVPSTQRIRTELGVRETVDLTESLRRTLQFHREHRL